MRLCRPLILIPSGADADLDHSDSMIAELNVSLCDAAAACAAIVLETLTLARLEVTHVLDFEGTNAEQRTPGLALWLADDAQY
jgi:hypothetical protein